MPEMILISVDLPAPLSPTSATTSPAYTSKSTWSSACTAPKRLETPLVSSSGVRPATLVIRVTPLCGDGVVRRPSRPPHGSLVSGDASGLAGLGVLGGADLVLGPEAIRDHRRGDAALDDGRRREQDGLDVR